MWPAPEIFTIPRHINVGRIQASMTTSTLAPRPLERCVPQVSRILGIGMRHTVTTGITERMFAITSGGGHTPILHDPTTFAIVAHLRTASSQRIATLRGSGIYTTTIPITARIAARTLDPAFTASGPLAAAEILDAEAFLKGLAAYGVDYRIADADRAEDGGTRLRAAQPR
jgi:hypothetical protein